MLVRAGKRSQETGFTLIELLVTMAVAIILATVAIPGFSSLLESNRLAAASNAVLSVANQARKTAIERRESIVVESASGSGDGWPLSVKDSLGNSLLVRESPHASITLSWTGASEITFNQMGRPDAGNSVCIAVQEAFRREVHVFASGKLEVLKAGAFVNCGGG